MRGNIRLLCPWAPTNASMQKSKIEKFEASQLESITGIDEGSNSWNRWLFIILRSKAYSISFIL